MITHYFYNDNMFTVCRGHLWLQVRNDLGRYEVAEFLEFIASEENYKVVASITDVTLSSLGPHNVVDRSGTVKSEAVYTEPLDVGLLHKLLRMLRNLQRLTLRNLWVYGGRAPYVVKQFSVKTLVLDNVHCFWKNTVVEVHLILSLFEKVENLQYPSVHRKLRSLAPVTHAEETQAYNDFVKATKKLSLPTVTGITIHTQEPELRVCIAPILSIWANVTSCEVNCRDVDDVNSIAILLGGGVGKRLTWFTLDMSTLQIPNAENPDYDIGPSYEQILEKLREPFSTMGRLQCFTLRLGSVSKDPFDKRTPFAFRYLVMMLARHLPPESVRHLTIDFDTYNHCPERVGVKRHDVAGLLNSWGNPSQLYPLTLDWNSLWLLCRHFTKLRLVELLWGRSPMETWAQGDREVTMGRMYEFSRILKGCPDSRGASCADERCMRTK